MNRPIKFRGKRVDNGEFVYGDLLHVFNKVYVNIWQVEPESVVQLVGFDRDGNEVYEGDELVGANGFEFKARFVGNLTDGDKLKEAYK